LGDFDRDLYNADGYAPVGITISSARPVKTIKKRNFYLRVRCFSTATDLVPVSDGRKFLPLPAPDEHDRQLKRLLFAMSTIH